MVVFDTVTEVRQRRGSTTHKSVSSLTVTSKNKKQKGVTLYRYEELPLWQRDNEHIHSGYVRETKSIIECLRSMTYFNNESVNIYTHLLPSLTYLLMLVVFTDVLLFHLFSGHTLGKYLMINLYLLGVCVCLICSSCFHCLKQHSEGHNLVWSKIDYVGIIVQITCSILSLLYYCFHDYRWIFHLFGLCTLILCCCCTVFVLYDKFNSVEYRKLRAAFFSSFAMSGLLPIIVGFFHFDIGGLTARVQLKFLIYEGLFYLCGTLVYVFRIPETFGPGKFDLVGNSHQIFHIMVVLGSVCHFRALVGSCVYMHTGMHYSSLLMYS